MFNYFPNNYVWSMSTVIAATHGGSIGEIDQICRPLLATSCADADHGTIDFLHAWIASADQLVQLAEQDLLKQRGLSAGAKYARATLYYLIAERMQAHGHPERMQVYQRYLQLAELARTYQDKNLSRVEISYQNTHLSAIYGKPKKPQEKLPIVVMMNGLDSTKELMCFNPLVDDLLQRGIAVLMVDQPGTGEAIRLQHLAAVYNSEQWASPIVDWLLQQPEIDPQRIAAFGISLGGYYCPRAMAFEPRFCCGAIWGANHDWRQVQQARLKHEGENPVPHYWQHVQWVFAAEDQQAFFKIAENMHLNGILDRITVPFLVTHGAQDRQIPLHYAHETFAQLTNSQDKELFIFDEAMGGVEHSSVDNPLNAGAYIADWLAEHLGGTTTK